ncbi:MAG: hypothetical protein J6Q82_02280 [Clostridia bacterium]|nr:hypothetical protein [Clostridia bacterium]
MNGTPRHNHHKHQPRPSQRRRVRRRQQITAILAVIGVTLLVLATVFLIIGARMHKKSVALRETETTAESDLPIPETPTTPSVIAYPLDKNSPYASLADLSEQGKSAASLALNEKDGISLYSPSTLQAIATDAKTQGLYLSGVFYLTSLSEEDDLARFTKRSDECATLAEALRAGLDEVMLVAPSLSEKHVEELSDFLRDLRRLVPNATVGLSLPKDFLREENAATVDALAGEFSLLAVDLSEELSIDERVEADLYYLLRYSMRVLLPSPDIEERFGALMESVTSHGINNLQFLP